MTERQAWLRVKKLFSGFDIKDNYVRVRTSKCHVSFGMCHVLSHLCDHGHLDLNTYLAMYKKIKRKMSKDKKGGYMYACNGKGAALRRKFCDRMISELKESKNGKKR